MRSLLIYLLLCAIAFADDTAFLCSQADAQLSCGQCIKKHPDCAWCTDPHSTAKNRCQLKTLFVNNSCHPSYVYSPPQAQVTVLKPTYPLESTKSDGTVVRLEPQQVSIRLMPGNAVNVPFKYLNRAGATTMEIQTSEYQNTALKLKFFINCDGAEKETKTCAVRENQIVEFRVEATLETCSSQGDITLSLGVRGQQIISALYVTPICGCECEKHNERNSPLCHQHGHLICGQCICDASRGGDKCECALSLYGVSSSAQLDAQCRDEESSEVCNGQGVCQCGKCRCNSPTISGKFCQCDHTSCPKGANGQICSSNGVCDCGKCKCEVGWEREDCSCSTANSNCLENSMVCSNNGHCECNRCVCNAGKTGAFCGSDEEIAETTLAPKEASSESEEDQKVDGEDAAEKTLEENVDKVDKNIVATSGSAVHKLSVALAALVLIFV